MAVSEDTGPLRDQEHWPVEGRRDRVIACLLVGVASVFWWDSNGIAAGEAQMYPRLVLIALFGLAILLFVRGLRMSWSRRGTPVISALRPFAAFIAITITYSIAVGFVGFFTSSAAYMVLSAWLIGLRRHGLNLAVTAIFLVATWLVFVGLFARPLPPELFWN